MVISIKHEMIVFWAFILCGISHGILFDFFRSLRKIFRHNKIFVTIEDIVFCTIAFKLFFEICYITNNGSLRWYIFASFICSVIIYFCVFSKHIFTMWNFIFKIIKKILFPFKKIIMFFYRKSKSVFWGFKKITYKIIEGISDKSGKILKKHKQTDIKQ